MCLLWQPAFRKLDSFHAIIQAWKENTNLVSNIINLLTVNPTAAYHIKGFVYLYPVDFMLDMGAAVSLLNTQLWDRIKGLCNKLVELHAQTRIGWSWGSANYSS